MQIDHVMSELEKNAAEMVALRRDIHAHPETSYEEVRTSALVQDTLTGWGVEVQEGLAVTGLVAVIRGAKPGNRAIGLRADMDALNMDESNGFAHRSQIPGKFHGCGHDGHTVMLLAAARYLATHNDFAGTVHCIFQPAEEGGAGALRMIDDGLFDKFPCDAVYSLHNKPGVPVGKFITRPGPQLACADTWTVTIHGTGGHAGAPEQSTDTTIALAHFIFAVQAIVARNVPALDAAVISIGVIEAGSSHNVMPAKVTITGTTRCHRPEIRDLIEQRLAETAHASAAIVGCKADLTYERGYPPLVNAKAETEKAIAAAAAVSGIDNVDGMSPPINAADDFAYLALARPGCNVMMGNGDDPKWKNNHRPDYDFNDESIPFGAAYWISIVHQELGGL